MGSPTSITAPVIEGKRICLFQRPTDCLDSRQQAAVADEAFDCFQVAVQGPISAQRANLLANVLIRHLRAPTRPQGLMELQPLRGTKQLTGQNTRCVDDHGAALAGRGRAHRYVIFPIG